MNKKSIICIFIITFGGKLCFLNEMIMADAVAEKVENVFYDTLPPYSVTVYSTQYN